MATSLAYRKALSTYAEGGAIGRNHEAVQRCLKRAMRLRVMAALYDNPCPGKQPSATGDVADWVVPPACYIRKNCQAAAHLCLT